MFKRLLVLLTLALTLSSCVTQATAGLNSFVDGQDGYEFLYPLGWVQTQLANGPDVLFRDFIEQTENVSVVIGDLSDPQASLSDLGSPTDVGQRMSQKVIAPPGSDRQAELISARQHTNGNHDYYVLEYAVNARGQQRHELVSVVTSRGKLFTFSASTLERRWPKIQELLGRVVESFTVY
ncbi:photosystem II reaction center PsbP [Leptolyngbya sp. FACHB-261]|uniref:photosystem II reaction center PsbP n=1 Tax=Leptolyngbya sp. FACHB-261 TaxID=2692806 RepID=UPI001681F1B8|nr:photosystem II reaction center PsbP [Leptolyngbya sp. FACHB-261]MBD2102985.1 photosystem II reaction center PsbP family protein [Leptolyngbya sp. FACHB-261]